MLLSPRCVAVMNTGYNPLRAPFARIAIEQFHMQTWENKRLVILNQDSDHPLCDGNLPFNVREYFIDRPADWRLGNLRNWLRHLCHEGDWLIHWDDDDYFHPELMRLHMEQRSKDRPTVLKTELRYDILRDVATYSSLPHGQSHPCYFNRKGLHEYPNRDIGEDRSFVESFKDGPIVIDNDPTMYVRIYHGMNVLAQSQIMYGFEQPVKTEHLEYLKFVRARYGSALTCLPQSGTTQTVTR